MHARTHTDTDTHTDLLQGQGRPLRAVGVYLEPPSCAMHRSFANSVRMTELMETKMYFYVNAPLDQGSALMNRRVNRTPCDHSLENSFNGFQRIYQFFSSS